MREQIQRLVVELDKFKKDVENLPEQNFRDNILLRIRSAILLCLDELAMYNDKEKNLSLFE
jgi:hypothetical protein